MAANDFIRNEYDRLLNGPLSTDKLESYSIITDSAIKLIYDQTNKDFKTTMDHEGYLLFQMTMIKGVAIKKIAEGIDYKSPLDKDLNMPGFLDPMSMWAIVRAQLEAYCNFNNIYLRPKSKPEQRLLYLLWVIAGLNERQRAASTARFAETKKKAAHEATLIESLIEEVQQNEFFKSLSDGTRVSIEKGINKRKFQWYFNHKTLCHGAWHQFLKNAGITNTFDHLYSMMSMKTHPSNVSVFQFREMYKEPFHIEATFFAMDCSKIIMAFFIRDYCEYHPGLKLVFNGLPEINQLMVNAHNRAFRGPQYAINDVESYV